MKCRECKYYEEPEGVCCYYKSEHIADFVDEDNSCEWFKDSMERTRLIDADKLISILEWNKWRAKDKLVSINSVIKMIENRPIDYDVDKVVDQWLENDDLYFSLEEQKVVREIVKAGGVDE